MEFFNRNDNKKRKSYQNSAISNKKVHKEEVSIGCFRRCCTKKKNSIGHNSKNQSLKQSEFFNESIFCGNITEIYDDPCLQCTVQKGPDLWENISRRKSNVNKIDVSYSSLNDNNIDARDKSAVNQMENSVKTKSIEEKIEDHQNSSTDDVADGYNWNLAMTSSSINQQTLSNQNFEPYNWDDPQYLTSLPNNSTKNLLETVKDRSQQFVANDYHTVFSDHEKTNHSFSTATVLSSDNDLELLHSQQSFSTAIFNENLEDLTRTKSQEKFNSNKIQTKSSFDKNNRNKPIKSIQHHQSHCFNTLNQIRTTYDELITSCRDFLHFLFSSIPQNNLSPSKTYSWSTETLNSNPFNHLGPWWGRRDSSDQMPSTYLFTHQSLSSSSLMNSQQMCISFENHRSECFWKYSNYCNSSITINK